MRLLLRLLARLPLPVLHALGSPLGIATLLFRPKQRRVMAENMRQAGVYSPAMMLRNASEFGKNILETLAVWLGPTERNLARIREVRGWEAVEAAHAAGRGILVLIPHLGNWELIGQFTAARLPFVALYRPPRQDWADALMREGRERNDARLATPDVKGVRSILAVLKQGGAAAILPDQVASKGDGVWTTFFGRPAYMPTLSHRLARSRGVAPFLFCCERLTWGRGYRLWISPLDDLPEDRKAGVARLNRQMEALILRFPEQYLWRYTIYRRRRRMGPPDAA
ncbi:MAG: lysophospholipid acyltransferase family protein [Thiobacillaceae bacterium]|jgi:KDO2-lipid IV(A) lauroyltransferase|nr:lysophospholipid acyltransferase family protein [Thiobacillaceae bacterium]